MVARILMSLLTSNFYNYCLSDCKPILRALTLCWQCNKTERENCLLLGRFYVQAYLQLFLLYLNSYLGCIQEQEKQ